MKVIDAINMIKEEEKDFLKSRNTTIVCKYEGKEHSIPWDAILHGEWGVSGEITDTAFKESVEGLLDVLEPGETVVMNGDDVVFVEKEYIGKTFKANTGDVFKFLSFKDGEFKAATKGISNDWLDGCLSGPVENIKPWLQGVDAVQLEDDPNGPKVEQ